MISATAVWGQCAGLPTNPTRNRRNSNCSPPFKPTQRSSAFSSFYPHIRWGDSSSGNSCGRYRIRG